MKYAVALIEKELAEGRRSCHQNLVVSMTVTNLLILRNM